MNCIHCGSPTRQTGQTRYRTEHYCPCCRRQFFIAASLPDEPRGISFTYWNHQGKADKLIEALSPKYTPDITEGARERARFMLTDNDVRGRVPQLERAKKLGVQSFLVYPHTARPSMINDNWPAWEGTAAQFVVNEYHAEVLRGYGYKKPLESIGWTLCPIREFRETPAREVLFMPIHPRNAPIDRKVNKEAFDRLVALGGAINLTVRYVGDLIDNGIPEVGGVTYIQGRMNQNFAEIDAADVVVGHQTAAWIAVARGVPTVMMAEDMPTHFRTWANEYVNTKSWDKVSHLFRYPLDILAEDDTMAILTRAARSDSEIADWRRRMIGEAFDPQRFVEIVERYL